MSSQIPPLVCHTPPPIDFDDAEDDDDYDPDIPEVDGIDIDEQSGAECVDDDFGDFATVSRRSIAEPIPTELVIENEVKETSSTPVVPTPAEIYTSRVDNESPPSLILSTNIFNGTDQAVSGTADEEDLEFQPFGCPSQPPEPPPEDSISLPSLHLDVDTSKSEDDDHIPNIPNPKSATGSGFETEVDLPAAAAVTTAERTTPVILEGGRFDDNTENDFTDFTTASNERSSVVLEIPTANDVSFELDDFAQLESTPSADSNFVSQQSRTDFATFDADFSKFDSFQASFPAAADDQILVKTPADEVKPISVGEQQSCARREPEQEPEDDFDDFQEFTTFSEQPVAAVTEKSPPIQLPTAEVKTETEDGMVKLDNTTRCADLKSTSENVGRDEHYDDDDDEFGEFSDFKELESTKLPVAPVPVPLYSFENVHSLLETMFPNTFSEPLASDTGQLTSMENVSSNSIYSQLQDFDNTSALAYQYSKSTSSKSLVTALGIDARNIMYGPKWNSSMPRFAANLSFNPLEPLKPGNTAPKDDGASANEKYANSSTNTKVGTLTAGLDPLQSTFSSSSSVPAVQFDWNSSGLVNPLEASHAHTLLLDLEQLEVMASLKDKINVDSSSHPPALRSTPCVANTVQLHPSPTMVTTSTTIKTPLLLSSPSRTSPPSPPQPKQPPIQTSSPPLLLTTINTQPYHPNHNDTNAQQLQTETNEKPSAGFVTDATRCTPLDYSTALLSFAHDLSDRHDGDLLICTSITTTPNVELTLLDNMTTNTTITSPLDGKCVTNGNSFSMLSDLQLIGFDAMAPGEMHLVAETEPTTTSTSDHPQSFDDYLDLSVQEMLQKASSGQPPDGTKSEVLDPKISEDPGSITSDDIAVMASVPPMTVLPISSLEEEEDVRSLDFTASTAGSNIVQYSASLPPANEGPQQQQSQPQLEPSLPLYYPPPPQPQPMSISSTSPNNVPVVRTIKLQETHIFTPSRGGTPVSRDITDRDIVVREYHDVEYSLEKTQTTAASKTEAEFDEFNDFQSVSAVSAPAPSPVASYARPTIGKSPTQELEHRTDTPVEESKNEVCVVQEADNNDDDDFTEFQTAIVPTLAPATVPQPVNKPVSSVQQNRSNTSSPVMLLSPAILLPQQASAPMGKDSQNLRHQQMSQINWPEPGIDPDELARFEAAFAKPAPPMTSSAGGSTIPVKVDNNQSVSKPQAVTVLEEDDWTDFISSKPEAANAASVPTPPASLNLASAGATPGGVVQEEWTDFISSTPATVVGPTSQQCLSSSQNNFNYPRQPAGSTAGKIYNTWNPAQLPPPQFSSWNSNSLYYNPMSSLAGTGQQQPPRQPQQFYSRPEHPSTFGNSSSSHAGGSQVPTNAPHQHLQHHAYQHNQASVGGRMLNQPMHLLPELSFITPNAAVSSSGAKPATHSFLSNVISSNSFTKK